MSTSNATQPSGDKKLSDGAAPNSSANAPNLQSQDIWSSILDSVASSRATPTKNVFMFGEPNVGKSTFLNFVRQENRVRDKPTGVNPGAGLESALATSSEEEYFKKLDEQPNYSKLALTHEYVDLKDEESEESMGRLNFYQVSDPHPRFHKLVSMILNYSHYSHSAAMIFLDWSRPWLFLENLLQWLRFLELAHLDILDHGGDPRTIDDPDRYTAGKALMEELTEKLSRYLQDYKDMPLGGGAEDKRPITSTPSAISLPPGCLTRNLGLPLIIVCSKSDKIKQVERDGDYKETHFDFIQQTLRTVCLQYGATLIYTSIHRPNSFSLLRNYILHRLFGVANLQIPASDNLTNSEVVPSILPPYLNNFKARGLMVEREWVFVPSGWDSFNKIRVLRESFQCSATQVGMERDLSLELADYLPSHHKSRFEVIEDDPQEEGEEEAASLNDFYSSLIPLPFSATRQAALASPGITAQPEQSFLGAHFAMFQGMDSAANSFPNPLPYVGTASVSLDRISKNADSELSGSTQTQGANTNAGNSSSTTANSFFKMLAMKENAKS